MWPTVIGVVALIYSMVCFCVFWRAATTPPSDDKIKTMAEQVAKQEADNQTKSRNLAPGIVDVGAISQLVTALVNAFKGAAPTVVSLVGAIVFLLLSGIALDVYKVAGVSGCQTAQGKKACDPPGNGNTLDDARDNANEADSTPANEAGQPDNVVKS